MDTSLDLLPTFGIAFVVFIVGFAVAFVLTFALKKKELGKAYEEAQKESKEILADARRQADKIAREAAAEGKEESRNRRRAFEEEAKSRRSEISKLENKLRQREANLEKKLSIIEQKEQELEQANGELERKDQRYKRLIAECDETLEHNRKTLQNIAKLTADEAKRELIRTMEKIAKEEAQERIQAIKEDAMREAESVARSTVSLAVQRIASEHVNDSTVSVVTLPSEDMKGRIIGREGRNIRAIESAIGVDLIIDDTPEAVIISSFNPVRREIAKISLERLIADGRIHPARVEETVKRVETEFDQVMQEHGEQAAFETGITDFHPELIKRLGLLRYRTTGQQSVLSHSIEVAHICGIMAGEMHLNTKLAKRAGLLHDIGKSVDQETEGHHSDLGAELCSKYEESSVICDAIRLHHQENLSSATPYAVILHAANSLSANRPGARKELLESYIKRLEDMEKIVKDFEGIESAFVVQAGREVRAMVTPGGMSDDEITSASHDIASALRKELTFPGQVRVTVIRESKFVDYAK